MWLHLFRCWRGTGDVDVAKKKGEWHGLAHNHLHSHTSMFQHSNLLTWSSKYWTMISCPEAAASISGVKPEPGSLCMREESWKSQKCEQIVIFFFDGLFRVNKDTHLTLASALLSSRNLTICWWPVLVQWNRAVQPTESFNSKSAPCFLGFKMEKKEEEKKKKCWMFTIKFKAQKECWI